MAKDEAVSKKITEIRGELLGAPSHEDLRRMQTHVDLLANIDLLMTTSEPGHHHDHMDDHDHALALQSIEETKGPE